MSAVSLEFENDLRNIYSRSRTLDEVTREIAALRDKIAGRRDAYEKEYDRTSQIIESRFDEDVRRVFRRLRDQLPAGLVQLDRDIADLVDGYLRSTGLAYQRTEQDGRVLFEVDADAPMPAAFGDVRRFATGDAQRAARRAAPESAPSAGPGGDRRRARLGGRLGCARASARTPALTCGRWPARPASSRSRSPTMRGSSPFSGWWPAAVVEDVTLDPALAAQVAALQAVDGEPLLPDRRHALAGRCDGRSGVRRSARRRAARAGALRAGDGSARAVRRRQGPGQPARAREHLGQAAVSADSTGRGGRVDRRATGSKPSSCASPNGTRRSNAASTRSTRGKTRSTGNGETSITSFATGRQP